MIQTGNPVISIYTEMTPNPETMKFVANKLLYPGKSIDFPDEASAAPSPLAQELFTFPFIRSVFIASNFITLTKTPETGDWQDVIPTIKQFLKEYLEEGKVVIFAAGTGNPFFTTDTAAALRGAEIGAQIVLKATKVDGVYSADPARDPSAQRYARISFDEAIVRDLKVMDATAFALCRDQRLPIKVFSILREGALVRVLRGEDEGTLVHV